MKPPKLVFIHGGPGLPDYLEPLFKEEFSDFAETLFYTQNSSGFRSIEDYLNELKAQIEILDSASVSLVGHSWGGILAAEYAFRHTSQIEKLILISSAFSNDYQKESEVKRRKTDAEGDPLRTYLSKEERPQFEPFFNELMAKFNSEAFEVINRDYLSQFDNRTLYTETSIPVLNIFGEEDLCIIPEHSQKIGSLHSPTENLLIKGAGHFPFLLDSNKKQCVEAIKQFLIKS